MMQLTIPAFHAVQQRKTFGCDESSFNTYIWRYASQNIKNRISRVF